MISVSEVTFSYNGGSPVFDDFSWGVASGEMWSIIGPSGCGKSSLLYLMSGLRQPQRGYVQVNGETIKGPQPNVGLILQDYGLLPWATIYENAALGLKLRGTERDEERHRVGMWLETLDLTSVAERYPSQISGGQRQRVAIARTLAMEPEILLMDEPFGSLDAITRESLQDIILDLRRRLSITTVVVTHNIEEAVLLGRKIMILCNPPNLKPIVLDNPEAGNPEYRDDSEFYITCRGVRESIGKVAKRC
ncbi:MAG: transporter [Dehalococcoidia bacterium]|nr:transporter [Dehalococcoidia bacterium]